MKFRKMLTLSFVIAVFMLVVLSACTAAQPPQNTLSYKRNLGYGSITEVVELSGMYEDDMSLEQVLAFTKRWMEDKYVITQAGETASAGSVADDILVIPYGQVGVVSFGAFQVVLPPRAYDYIPQDETEDEIRVVPALCVTAGQIAWRIDFDGSRKKLVAQQECYLLPAEGWQFDAVLEIKPGELAWQLNPQGERNFLYDVGVYGSELNSDWTKEPYLNVANGQMAYQLQADGSYAFKAPGIYNREIDTLWEKVAAPFIGQTEFGVYLEEDGTYSYIPSGRHFNLLPSNLVVYSSSQIRYRTLSISHLGEDPEPEVVNAYLASDSKSCQSDLCETLIDKVVISGTQTLADFNVDVLAHVVGTPGTVDQFPEMGHMAQLIQDKIGTFTRNGVRIACSSLTREQLRTQEGEDQCALLIKSYIEAKIGSLPIVIDSVNIRSKSFHDGDLIAAAATAEVQALEAQARIEQARLELLALEEEQKLFEAQQEVFDYQLAQLDAWLTIFANAAKNGLSVGHLLILMESGVLPYGFEIGPNGELVLPPVTVTAPGVPVP